MGKKNKRSLKAELKRIRKNVEIANSSIDKISKKTKKKNQKILKQMHDIIEEASAESFMMRRMAGEDEEDIDQALSSSKKKKKKKGFTAISLTVLSSRRNNPPVHPKKPIPDVDRETIDAEVVPSEIEGHSDEKEIAKDPSSVNNETPASEVKEAIDGDPCPAPKKARKTKKETKE